MSRPPSSSMNENASSRAVGGWLSPAARQFCGRGRSRLSAAASSACWWGEHVPRRPSSSSATKLRRTASGTSGGPAIVAPSTISVAASNPMSLASAHTNCAKGRPISCDVGARDRPRRHVRGIAQARLGSRNTPGPRHGCSVTSAASASPKPSLNDGVERSTRQRVVQRVPELVHDDGRGRHVVAQARRASEMDGAAGRERVARDVLVDEDVHAVEGRRRRIQEREERPDPSVGVGGPGERRRLRERELGARGEHARSRRLRRSWRRP